jgi:hypothetical protein
MNASEPSINTTACACRSKGLTVALWTAQLAVAGILGMMAFVKFFNYTPEGSMALADALGVGRGMVTLIGLVETAAVITILWPRRSAVGGLLGTLTALGALASHAAKIGFSGSPVAEMWPMALLVLAASAFVLVVRRNELPVVGRASRVSPTASDGVAA